jgi:thiamine biosynthesis lipoprotein
MKALGVLTVLTLVLAIWAAPAGAPLRIESSIDAMGSTFSIVAYGEDPNRLQQAVDIAFEEVRRLDSLLSNYKPRSEWSQVNQSAGERPVRVSPELFQLLEACLSYSRESDGAFDITVGPLVKVWGFYKGSGRVPHRAEIRGSLARVGYKNIVLNRDDMTVQFRRGGVEIDPGGIGKGYTVDRMIELIKERGIRSALVSAGGSSIYGLGAPPNASAWKINIRHPKRPTEMVGELELNNLSMSTSGTSEKFFVSGGKLYSHIFDPRTGYPATGMLSVSVVTPRTLDSEAWTKPVFINGAEWSRKRLPQGYRAFLCEDKPGTPCAWLQ